MTDPLPTPNPQLDYARLMQRIEDHQRQLAQLREPNKTALFDALERAEIARVRVSFDGYGDSGQIETIDADDREGRPVALPAESVLYQRRDYGDDEIRSITHTVREAVETMVYDCLEQTHPGWENNDGADGTFTFDVVTRTITLEHNQHFVDTNSYEHVF